MQQPKEPLYYTGDWEGKPVPPDEDPAKLIKVWQITPHLTDSSYDSCLIRSWQGALEYVKQNLEICLEGRSAEDLLSYGISVHFKLVQMTVGDYHEIMERDD